LLSMPSYAQDAPTMFAVYEAQVKPSSTTAYRDAVKKFVATCKQQKMSFSWVTGSLDDNSYVYIVPIKGFADLDKNMFDDLQKKIGTDAMAGLFKSLDVCTETQTSTVELLMPKLSYLQPGPDDNFRNVFYWVPQVGKMAEAEALLAEWVKASSSKNCPAGFQIFRTVFGGQPRFISVSWGKNQADLAQKLQKNHELMGDEGAKLWEKVLSITKSYYTKVGWIENELGYAPAPN